MPALTAAGMASNWAIRDESEFCSGCGVHVALTGEHRPDCTAEPSLLVCAHPDCDAIRLPSERGPLWLYQPASDSYLCPTHHQKGTTE